MIDLLPTFYHKLECAGKAQDINVHRRKKSPQAHQTISITESTTLSVTAHLQSNTTEPSISIVY
jgi:hypothetical protein